MVAVNKSGLTPEVLRALENSVNPDTGKRWTQAEIANEYEVSSQHISWMRSVYDIPYPKGPRAMMREAHWPFGRMANNQAQAEPARRLGDHLEWVATQGAGWSCSKKNRLRRFYERLVSREEVIEYDPDIEPYKGMPDGGWAFRKRRKSDGELIIRLNLYTRALTEADNEVWRLPPSIPQCD